MDIFSITLLFFIIMDPLGNLPVFTVVLKHVDKERRFRVVMREMLIALLILIIFFLAGEYILIALNLKQESVGMAGAIILFIISIRMIFPVLKQESDQGIQHEEPFIVPMATPLVAGPSILATLILLSHQHPDEKVAVFTALFSAWAISLLILSFSGPLMNFIGNRGAIALERLTGLVLVMLSVQLFLDALRVFLQ